MPITTKYPIHIMPALTPSRTNFSLKQKFNGIGSLLPVVNNVILCTFKIGIQKHFSTTKKQINKLSS